MCGWRVKLCDPLITRGTSERFQGIAHYVTKHCTNSRYFTFLFSDVQALSYAKQQQCPRYPTQQEGTIQLFAAAKCHLTPS